LADVTQQVGGDAIELYTLVGLDSDAHVFNPSPVAARKVGQADLVVMNGLGFEGWMERLLQSSGFKGTAVTASRGITPRTGKAKHIAQLAPKNHEGHDGHHDEEATAHKHLDIGGFDPHAWHDIDNVVVYTQNIAEGLSQADPDHSALYQANAKAYIAKLKALDVELSVLLADVPPAQRKAITSHDAFGYLADKYHLTFIAPQGSTTESEASARDVAMIIRQIRSQHITALFVENIADRRLLEQISRETHAKVGGTLYSDALAKAAPTYIEMMRHNVTTIAKALQ
jgi:zinc/manganese transport system substrate-binding protein